MYSNWIFANVDRALPSLAHHLLREGDEFGSRAGLTRDVTHFGITLQHPWEREITLSSRKHNLAAQIAETMWVLSGRDDVEWLGHYLPRAADFSDDGQVWRGAYGRRLRRWPRRNGDPHDVIDQLAHVVEMLQKDQSTRRAVLAIYDPNVDTAEGKDIPCNDFITFSCRNGALDMGVTIRSNDLIWGWSGINAFEWSVLQEIVAVLAGVEQGSLHFSITSLHLYERHWTRAEKIANDLPAFPEGVLSSVRFQPRLRTLDYFDDLTEAWFAAENFIRTGHPAARRCVENFPEPLLRCWLRVLQWWWSGDGTYLEPLQGTRLATSAQVGVQPPKLKQVAEDSRPVPRRADFSGYVTALHSEKHAAYGDSWKRRGEMLGIMANIARKIDRLGGGATSDETSADTAIDLLVYLAKYRWWLSEVHQFPNPVVPPVEGGDPESTNALIRVLDGPLATDLVRLAAELEVTFANLEDRVMSGKDDRWQLVDDMLPLAYSLAYQRWAETQK